MTIHEIVKEYLKYNGFDGLAGDECGCLVEDLMCCDCLSTDCVPAMKVMGCSEDCGMGCDWHMVPEKQ